MTFGITSIAEARERVRQRLMDGWVAVIGNSDAICQMETTLYPPGTPKNADFEMVGTFPFVFLAKKTDELQQLCQRYDPDGPDFDALLALNFHVPVNPTGVEGDGGWLVGSTVYDKVHGSGKAAAIDRLVLHLTQQWGDLTEPQQED